MIVNPIPETLKPKDRIDPPEIAILREKLGLSRCRLRPYIHQVEGISKLLENPYFFIADEMGAGKTKQVIDTAQILFSKGLIERVIIIAPAAVRSVWFDDTFGELAKHLWNENSSDIFEYHSKIRVWGWGPNEAPKAKRLQWIIANYEFIRSKPRLLEILPYCSEKTLLVLDESSAVKSHKAAQTKACNVLRKACGRIILLNGTPIANNPGDLFSQADLLSPTVLGCKSYFHFRARYALMGGWQGRQITGWRDIDDLQKRLAPYVLRRLKEQCLDLPEKMESIVLSVAMSEGTWKIYKQMRDDMVSWLNENTASSASQAIVKAIRLAQITSGFLGGVEVHELDDWIEGEESQARKTIPTIEEIGREKLDFFLEWYEQKLEEDPNLKLLVWCRFRPEVQRLFEELNKKYPKSHLGKIWGGQKKDERDRSLQLLDPRSMPSGPVVIIGTPATGSMGLNLTGAHTVIYLSNDFSLKTRLQSEDRVHRPGQISNVSYFDVIVTGPNGQKTIDHLVVKSLKAKEELANFTTSAWLDALRD